MSRNQREGKFIPGWCLNPNMVKDNNGVYRHGVRAGAYANLKRAVGVFDGYATIPGVSFVRYLRPGV
jgi:hypothetical protein